jgi:hypothetical protein
MLISFSALEDNDIHRRMLHGEIGCGSIDGLRSPALGYRKSAIGPQNAVCQSSLLKTG